jgi:hypothetical protein
MSLDYQTSILKDYPEGGLNLTDLPFKPSSNEVVLEEVERNNVILWAIALCGMVLSLISFTIFFSIRNKTTGFLIEKVGFNSSELSKLSLIFVVLSLIIAISTFITIYVFKANRMFISNEHVIRVVQNGIASVQVKTVGHMNIEDVSDKQNVVGQILGYGKLVLSTEGDGVVYSLNFVKNPEHYVRLLVDVRDSYQAHLAEKSSGGTQNNFIEEN